MNCPRIPGVVCPGDLCPGSTDIGACRHIEALSTWRSLGLAEQTARLSGPRPRVDPAVRDAVIACPDRGSVLPISLQDDCGCQGREVSECRAGKGATPGRATLRDCLVCRGPSA